MKRFKECRGCRRNHRCHLQDTDNTEDCPELTPAEEEVDSEEGQTH